MSRKAPTILQLYIPGGPSKREEIHAEAEARGKSASALLLEAYDEYITNHPKGGKP
jgi:hypothetical protein